jgi:hypothetical protein
MNTVQLDLATLALKGERYNEAERIYMDIATANNSCEAWVGLAVSKLYQLAADRNLDEVDFCIKKAKEIDPALVASIDAQLMLTSQTVLATYVNYYVQAYAKSLQLNRQANQGATLAVVAASVGLATDNRFTTFAALAGAGTGVGVAVNALNKIQDINELKAYINQKIEELNAYVYSQVATQSENFRNYNQFVFAEKRRLTESVIHIKTQDSWWSSLPWVLFWCVVFIPVGMYGLYKWLRHCR